MFRVIPVQDEESQEVPAKLRPALSGPKSAVLILVGFVLLWLVFFALNRATPYIGVGSDVATLRKKNYELEGKTFPGSFVGVKLAVFGNSKVLSGFVPDDFDALAARDRIPVYSFNSGFPAQSEFVDELAAMTEHGVAPDVVLLTIPWQPKPKSISIFKLSSDDHQLADEIFPFRLFVRNLARFIVKSHNSGGMANLYRKDEIEAEKVIQARGYYFIKDLSKYPGDRLPPDYTLASDDPAHVAQRQADFDSAQLDQLNSALEKHKVRCFYIPVHLRSTEAAPAPAIDNEFASLLATHSSCRVLGPDYISYPNSLYSDEAHLNPEGARQYTEDIYKLVAPYLRGAD
jgi:hypothetical protein